MSEDRGPLRAIAWHECLPWLIILRATLIGFYLRVILLAYVGVCIAALGPWISGVLFEPPQADVLSMGNSVVPASAVAPVADLFDYDRGDVAPSVPQVWLELSAPFRALFERGPFSVQRFTHALFVALWYTATWAFFGGAICRIAAMEFTVNDRCGLKPALGHACRKFLAYFLSPLFPLIGVFVLMLFLVLIGLVNWIGPPAAVVTGIFGFIAVLIALAIGLLLVPLLLGWPLMWGAISTECSDHFDALSRCYAYTTQRPFHYLGYALVAIFAGAVGLFAVGLLVWVAQHTLQTGLIWGQGREQTLAIVTHDTAGPIWRFWIDALSRIVTAYAFGFFFSVAAAIYLLLRRDVDQAELDEIIMDEDQPRFAMPILDKDAEKATVGDPLPPDQGPSPEPEA